MSDEFNNLQRRLQSAVDDMLGNLSKSHIRPIQQQSFLCMAKCFDSAPTDAQVQNCLNNCGQKAQSCQSIIQNEMNQFQSRLQRCSEVCQDEAKESFTPSMRSDDPSQVSIIEQNMVKCASACVEKHISMLPNIHSRIVADIKR
jgi:hypothetical protein